MSFKDRRPKRDAPLRRSMSLGALESVKTLGQKPSELHHSQTMSTLGSIAPVKSTGKLHFLRHKASSLSEWTLLIASRVCCPMGV